LDKPFIPPTDDDAFKYLFGRSQSAEYLPGLLSSVLDIPLDEYENVSVGSTHLLRRFKKDKLGIIDVKVITKSGTILNIEMQNDQKYGMRERTTFYSDRLFTDQGIKPDDEKAYVRLNKTIVILITDYDEIKEDRMYHHRFRLYDDENDCLWTDKQEIHTIELTKTPEDEDSTLVNWMRFLGAKSKEEIEMLGNKDPYIAGAVAAHRRYSLPREIREIYEARKKAKIDKLAELAQIRYNGIEEGREEGREEAARRMKAKGYSVADIEDITGLSSAEIEKL
jgi:predicted transposase/invertase (TIGR01784 family)